MTPGDEIEDSRQVIGDCDVSFVYKFRDWDVINHRRTLSDGEIFIADIRSFNDPFEFFLPVDFSIRNVSKSRIRKSAFNSVSERLPHLNRRARRDVAKAKYHAKPWKDKKWSEEFQAIIRDSTAKQFGVCCFAGALDNLLLWSHYSNGHRGFALEYDTRKLATWALEQFTRKGIMFSLDRVNYVEQLKAEKFWSRDENLLQRRLVTKGESWSYEKEYRLILWEQRPNRAFKLPVGTITRVILGCAMDAKVQERITDIAASIGINAAIAKPRRDAFHLDFELLK